MESDKYKNSIREEVKHLIEYAKYKRQSRNNTLYYNSIFLLVAGMLLVGSEVTMRIRRGRKAKIKHLRTDAIRHG